MFRSTAEATAPCDRHYRMVEYPGTSIISSKEAMTITLLESKTPQIVHIRFMIIPINSKVLPISAIIWMKASQLIFMLNGSYGDFQIPDTPGIPVAYTLPDNSSFDSAELNETRNEQFDYGIISYKKEIDTSAFNRP